MASLGFPWLNISLNLRGDGGVVSPEGKLADEIWSEFVFSPLKKCHFLQQNQLVSYQM